MESRDERSVGRRLSRWALGLVAAAIAAALTEAITGGLSSAGRNLWDQVTGKQPVAVTALPDVVDADKTVFRSYLFERAIGDLTRPPLDFDKFSLTEEWARENGGLDADRSEVEVVVTGRSEDPVILRGLDVNVLDRSPPPTATHVRPAGGGPLPARYFEIDLDRSPPSVEFGRGAAAGRGARPIRFPYRVSRTDPEVFLLIASTEKCDCRWVAELHWVAGGKPGKTVIRDGRHPFRTVSGSRSVRYTARNGRFIRE